MKLYIVRHGETDWNKEKRCQGQTDTQLNEYGRELARITRDALKDVTFDIVYSSPLSRAYETASIICESRNIEIKTDDRLKEISFGVFEGLYPDQRPEDFMNFFDAPHLYKSPEGAETYNQLLSRTRDFLDNVIIPLSVKCPDITVLISGHGAMNKSLLMHLKGLELKDLWSGIFQKNCCVNIFEINGNDFELIQEGKIYYDV